MTLEIIALILTAVVSIIIPLVVLGVLIARNRKQWKGIGLLFVLGAVVYVAMEWGLKEHGLAWLFNHTKFMDFMNNHYIPYLLVVAFAGAVFAVLPMTLMVVAVFKKQVSFAKAIAFGLGYTMLESTLLIGYKSINTVVELVKESETELNTTSTELFLSSYERVLLMVIHIAIVVTLVYFIEHKMTVQGNLIAVFCHTLVSFLPGFFIAFTLTNYYEVYDRSIALILVYIVLTAAAISSLIILNSFKYELSDS